MEGSNSVKTWRDDLQAKIQTILISKLSPQENQNDNETRIKEILLQLSNENTTPDINVIPEPRVTGKSKKMSMMSLDSGNWRRQGNLERNRFYEKVYYDYTKSIAHARADSFELSKAYVTRGHFLSVACMMPESLKDFNRVQLNIVPDYLKADLFVAQSYCYYKCVKWDLPGEKNEDIMKYLVKRGKPRNHFSTDFEASHSSKDNNYRSKLNKQNPMIPGLSESLMLEFSKKSGRHIVAKRNIAPGEIIGIQKAYASVVDNDMRYNYCWHCTKQTWSTLPCDNCANVVFCSEFCIGEANKNYHSIECPIFSQILEFGISPDVLLGLRLTIMAWKESRCSVETLRSTLLGFDEKNSKIEIMMKGMVNGVLEPNNLSSVQGLSSEYLQDCHAQNSEVLANSIVIGYLLARKIAVLNKKTPQNIKNLQSNDKFVFLIGVIEKNMRIAKNNNFLLKISTDDSKNFTRKNVCNSIVPAFSFFNHSCDKNFIRNIIGDQIVLTAICPIKKGEEIVDNYHVDYFEKSKEARQAFLLENYGFICDCPACVEDWQEEEVNNERDQVEKLENQARKLRTLVSQPDFNKNDISKYLGSAAKMNSIIHRKLKKNSSIVTKANFFLAEHLNCAGESYIAFG